MKTRIFSLALCIFFIFIVSPSLAKETEIDYIEGQIVVAVDEDYDYNVLRLYTISSKKHLLETYGFKVIDSLNDFDEKISIYGVQSFIENREVIKSLGNITLIDYSQNYSSASKAIEEVNRVLSENGYKVKYVEPNYVYSINESSIPSINDNQTWNYSMINLPDAWKITTGDKKVRIAVLDTGIDYNHQSLNDFVDSEFRMSVIDDTVMDEHGHGTRVAGIIASYGEVSGVMNNATLIPVKVLDKYGRGTLFSVQQGIIYALEQNIDIINISFGGTRYSQGMEEVCKTAYLNGTVIVAAIGNSGDATITYPANHSTVISVGAVDYNRIRAEFSNYGESLDVMAPGVSIYSTDIDNKYSFDSGTSFAASHISGVIGLMKTVNEELTVDEIKSILIENTQEAGAKTYYGYGIVDAHSVLTKAIELKKNSHNSFTLGDLNQDNVVNSLDLVLMRRYILNIITELSYDSKKAADINGDGKIDSTDYVILKRYILGIIDRL
ncbi:UNVERIFIED_CONTAM: dockerin type I repeat protein [Acetivibrio alkalicellulosi]